MYASKQYEFGNGAVGLQAVTIAASKTSLGWGQAVVLGALCNALVCLAVWLCYSARTTADKILAIIPPIAAFVAAGFEHSVANMYFIPYGLLVNSNDAYWSQQQDVTLPTSPDLTWSGFVDRQPHPRDDREHRRRRAHGRSDLLVRLPAPSRSQGLGPASYQPFVRCTCWGVRRRIRASTAT